MIDLSRVIEKLDSYLFEKDFAAAERHLDYWQSEAELEGDKRSQLVILNEKIGFYRKNLEKNKAMEAISNALDIANFEEFSESTQKATTYLNSATAYEAFDDFKTALGFYKEAQKIYEKNLDQNDSRMGGLYNNMALAYANLGDYKNAENYYKKALAIMEKQEKGFCEVAITYLNLADLAFNMYDTVEAAITAENYCNMAEKLLLDETIEPDGYYAYVCEKCAPVFGKYGFLATEAELNKRANFKENN